MIPDKPSSARLSTRDFFEKKFLVGIKSQKPQGVVACSHSRPMRASVGVDRRSAKDRWQGRAEGPRENAREGALTDLGFRIVGFPQGRRRSFLNP